MSFDSFIEKYSGLSEEYKFYNGEVTLRYEPKSHKYFLIENGRFLEQNGVTNTCHIIDRSEALIPWACKMMANKLLTTAERFRCILDIPVPGFRSNSLTFTTDQLADWITASKTAHKEKLDEAANIGTIAHAWIEQYIKAYIVRDISRMKYLLAHLPENEKAKNCCNAALDWMRQHNVRWIHTEKKVYSRRHRYAGTMDGLAMIDSCNNPLCCHTAFKDRLSVADWKSSNYLYIEFLLQTSSYEAAYEEEFGVDIVDRWVIRLGKEDGEFDPWHLEAKDFEADFKAFLSALQLVRDFEAVEKRMKDLTGMRRAVEKAAEKLRHETERAEAMKIKCKGADKYKAVRPPRCNNNQPCEACVTKYREKHQAVVVSQ